MCFSSVLISYFFRPVKIIKYVVLSLFRLFTLRFPFSAWYHQTIASTCPSLSLLSPGLSLAPVVIARTKKKLSACLISPIGADLLSLSHDSGGCSVPSPDKGLINNTDPLVMMRPKTESAIIWELDRQQWVLMMFQPRNAPLCPVVLWPVWKENEIYPQRRKFGRKF